MAFKRRIFSASGHVLAVQGHSGSSKVDDFGTNRKLVCDFLLVCHCNYGSILHRFWDTLTYWLKIAYFSYPSLIRRPRSLCSLNLEFCGEVNREETRVVGLSSSEDPIVAWVVLTQCQRVTDRQTDIQTDGQTDGRIYYSYAAALSKISAWSVVHGLGELEQSLVNACSVLFKVAFLWYELILQHFLSRWLIVVKLWYIKLCADFL